MQPQDELAVDVAHAVVDAEEGKDLIDRHLDAVGPLVEIKVLGTDESLVQELLADECLQVAQ